MDTFTTLNWEEDPILSNPTKVDFGEQPLDDRVEQFLADRQSQDSVESGKLVIAEFESISTATPRSDWTPDHLEANNPIQLVPTTSSKSETVTNKPNGTQVMTKPVQPTVPLVSQVATLSSSTTVVASRPTQPTIMANVFQNIPDRPKAPPLQRRFETPKQKIERYESLRTKYRVHKQNYLDKFRYMKNQFRKVKCTLEADPPSDEVVKLFDQVKK